MLAQASAAARSKGASLRRRNRLSPVPGRPHLSRLARLRPPAPDGRPVDVRIRCTSACRWRSSRPP